ncbi:unnamed protein product [Haemonchus placei]|uniref:Dehydrogenase/reductase SDR family member 4 n=1 Tax=Haemonchus placei TaxID=6290 RepID=A0A158QLV9_HAEPC|nr:unnamed protein product [Haemonchus placei]
MTSCRRLEGKVAIVTAATKGIGLAIAERLGLEGAAVVICSRNKKNVDDAVQYLKSKGVSKVHYMKHRLIYLIETSHRHKTIAKYSKIDILINNHGINPAFGHILDVEDSIWDKLFEVNVKSGWQLTKLVHPHMVKNGGGNIVFNASIGGYKSPPGIAAYGVTKTALLGLTKALANGLAKDNIRVNAIAPGVIKTKMSEALWSGGGDQGEKDVVDAMEIPLSRLGTPNDCAGAVAFLVSDDAQYITGETILMAGGVHARL